MGAAAIAARSNTTTKFTLLTTMYIRDDLPPTGHPMLAIRPTVDIRVQGTRHDRCLIRLPGLPTTALAESIILTTREFLRRGHTTRRRRGRPTRISPSLTFQKRLRFLTI